MTFRRQSGTAYLTVDGTTIPAKGSFAVPLTTTNRTDLVVGDQVVGFDEQTIAPYVQCTVQITDETDFERICSSTAMTVRVEFANGRIYTLSNAFVILDEAQNTTREQMKMFLTRMGEGSKMVVTGDATQVDLPEGKKSGLVHAIGVLKDIDGIAICRLTDKDVVRHPLVMKIVRAYEQDDKRSESEKGEKR